MAKSPLFVAPNFFIEMKNSCKVRVNVESNGDLVFFLAVDRFLIRSYIASIAESEGLARGGKDNNLKLNIRSIVFSSRLSRDFQNTVLLFLSALNISRPFCFPTSSIVFCALNGDLRRLDYSICEAANRKDWWGLRPLELDPFEFFGFTEIEFGRDPLPKTRFGRAFSFLSLAFQAAPNRPFDVLMWSIASIEASLGKERSNSSEIEAKIRALIPEAVASGAVKKFKKLYQLRNNLVHGASMVPLSFSSDVVSSDAFPFEDALFAQRLAIRLLQEHFLKRKYDLSFRLISE